VRSALVRLSLVSALSCGGSAAAYASAAPHFDPVMALKQDLESRAVRLEFQKGAQGYLGDLLARLQIDPESQILVFSKTSLQHKFISPATPRAIYFNDSIAVGYVQNAPAIEIISTAPGRSYTYYTLANVPDAPPALTRHQDAVCANCHGPETVNQPGMLVASTPMTADGAPVFLPERTYNGMFNITDQRTPLAERWSGWYVTGTHGAQMHLGNGAVFYGEDGALQPVRPGTQNLTTLDVFFDTAKYLRRGSDIVALMTFEHQSRVSGLLLAAALSAQQTGRMSVTQVNELADRLLFVDEAPITAPIAGTSAFAVNFAQRGPRDHRGRSLRDFDLHTRLFQYPLSYMVYSRDFAAIPPIARAQISQRLFEILSGKDAHPRYEFLSDADRRVVLEIVNETSSDLAAAWRAP